MVGRFTETTNIEHIRKHLLHGRIVYAFTGKAFILFHYDLHEEKGLVKTYNIVKNMDLTLETHNLFSLIGSIKGSIISEGYHYLLYYGELGINDSIYDFMKEFYNPEDELPLLVATAVVEPESIRMDISHPCNIKGKVLEYADEFLSSIVGEYLNEELFERGAGSYSIFSVWLEKDGRDFDITLRSRYSELIESHKELVECEQKIVNELGIEMKRLGIAENI